MSCYLLKEGHLRSAYEFYGDDRWYLGLLFFFFCLSFYDFDEREGQWLPQTKH